MSVRIVTLSENTAGASGLLGERGLSVLVATETSTVLFDAGQGISAAHNAAAMGIDLGRIDKIALSHGHYDHTGGLRPLLQRLRREVGVIAHPDIWQAKYQRGEPNGYIGIPFQRRELEGLGAVFNLTASPVRISEDIMTTGEIAMVTDFERVDAGLLVREGSEWRPDVVRDDQALVVDTDSGLVVVLGCAHRGVINTLYHARRLTGKETIRAVVGGSHLVSASEEQLWLTIAALREMGVQQLGLCHCTGLPAAGVLAQEFGEAFFFNRAGTVLSLA